LSIIAFLLSESHRANIHEMPLNYVLMTMVTHKHPVGNAALAENFSHES